MSEIIVFSDGSCDVRDRIGGYGAVLSYKGKEKEIYGGEIDTTISRMELLAPIKALESIKTTHIPVLIHSDSAYVVNCFKDKWYVAWERGGRWMNSKKQPVENRDLWERLLALYRKQENCTFVKVKGHSGNSMNDKVDGLANKGRLEIRDRK